MLIKAAADPRGWSLWREPRPVLALVLAVYAAALLAVFPLEAVTEGSVYRFLILAIVGGSCSLLCRRMERARKFLESGAVPNLAAVWTFAGALCLPHPLAAALVVVIYAVQWNTQKSLYIGKAHRYVFGAGTVIAGVRIAQFGSNPVVSGALLLGVNLVLVATAMAVSGNAAGLRRMRDPREQGTEILTLILGSITAELIEWHLGSVLLTVPVLVVLQYVSLCRHIRQPSTFDQDTGALTIRAWNALGTLRLSQVPEAIVFQVLIGDTGGRCLRECGQILRGAVRPEDLIGRTSDGFMVLVAAPTDTMLTEMLALQIQARFAADGIATYVGSATTPDQGRSMELSDLAVAASAEVIVRALDIGVS